VFGEGAPDAAGGSVGEGDLAERFLFLANVDARQIVGRNGAQLVDVHEQVGVLRFVALGDEVLELLGFVGDVVQRQIQAQVEAAGDFFDVGPAAVPGIDFLVGEWRKTAIGIRWVGRQNVYAANHAREVPVDDGVQVCEIVPHAVGVGDQLDLVA